MAFRVFCISSIMRLKASRAALESRKIRENRQGSKDMSKKAYCSDWALHHEWQAHRNQNSNHIRVILCVHLIGIHVWERGGFDECPVVEWWAENRRQGKGGKRLTLPWLHPFLFLNTLKTHKQSALICGNIRINKTTALFSTFFHPHSYRYHWAWKIGKKREQAATM